MKTWALSFFGFANKTLSIMKGVLNYVRQKV